MKKYKKTLHIYDFQQKLDNKYGKGKFHAVLVLSLFFCLSFTSCSNDLHNSGTTNRSNIGGSIEGTTHEGQSSGARIQITNTGQTVTLNKPPYGDNPTVLDAYFARQDTKSNEYKKINSAIIGDVVYIVVDTANLFAKKITVTIKDKNNIISGNIPFQQYKSNGNKFADKYEDVKGIFEAKVRNEINDQRFALYKIALKGKDEVTTKKWKEDIEKHPEKKLQLSLTVQADEKNVIYCGSNNDKDNEKNVWLNQDGKWFGVDICVCGDWANISSFIDKEDFIGWKTPGIEENCFAYALAEMERVNFTLKSKGWMNSKGTNINPDIFQIFLAQDILGRKKGVQKEEFKKGIQYLKDSIKNKIPVMVGVDNHPGSPNADKTTDHFIVIVGMGNDSVGKYFLFHDNAMGNKNVGASNENRLYCKCKEYKLEGVADKRNSYFSSDAGYKIYTVSQIRKSKRK